MAQVSKRAPEDVLKEQLAAKQISPRLYKIAARAFNKRCSVLFMQDHPDETRGG